MRLHNMFMHLRSLTGGMILLSNVRSRRGAASALIILLIVLLVFFGMLAMLTASADLRLAQRRAAWTQSYYLADQQAEIVIARLDALLTDATQNGMDQLEIFLSVNQLLESQEDVEVFSLYEMDGSIYLEARVYNPTVVEQGIDFSISLHPEQNVASERVSVMSWLQWQPPAQTADRPGLWDGD